MFCPHYKCCMFVQEVRKRFDKASLHYDQVREKFLSLKKDAKVEVVSEAEEDLRNAKSQFEQARFNLVSFPLGTSCHSTSRDMAFSDLKRRQSIQT
jgi:hypothetical protein